MGDLEHRTCPSSGRIEGFVKRKLEKMGETVYSYEVERVLVKIKSSRAQKETSVGPKSRRQWEKTCERKKLA